ncbi:MAG: Gfo/Idh/MocA family oxidoreductase [Tepidisphaeraceae bacterium]
MLRIGICGCGGISHIHAECLAVMKEEGLAELVAGAEVHAGRRSAWHEKWRVPVYESLRQMLAERGMDAVIVTSPSGLHAEHVIEAARAGVHVLCEKPLDVRLDRADAAIGAVQAAGVMLGGVFQQRFSPGPQKAKRAVDAGAFGRIVSVHCETPWYRNQLYYDQDAWRGTWALDGGVLGNQAPHMIDRMMWLGGEIEQVLHAELRPSLERSIEGETVAAVIVRLASGAIGTITATTLAYPGLPQRVVVCGTDGSCAFSGDDLTFFSTREPFEATDSVAGSNAVTEAGSGVANPLSIGAGAFGQHPRFRRSGARWSRTEGDLSRRSPLYPRAEPDLPAGWHHRVPVMSLTHSRGSAG